MRSTNGFSGDLKQNLRVQIRDFVSRGTRGPDTCDFESRGTRGPDT